MLGVYDRKLVEPIAEVLKNLGSTHAWVVHGADGMDELTTTGVTHGRRTQDGDITRVRRDARRRRSAARAISQISKAAMPPTMPRALRALLHGEPGPYRDIVLLNTAAALIVAGKAANLEDGVAKAQASIDSGRAARALDRLVAVTNEVA